MVGHFDVDVVGRHGNLARPALVNELDELAGNIHTPTVVPAVVEPLFEFLGGVVVEDVNVEFTLHGESGEDEVAGAKETGDGVVGIGAETEVKLGVERVAEMEFDNELACLELRGEPAQAGIVLVGRGAEGELVAEFLGELAFESDD